MRATLISGAVKESRVCSFEGGKAKTLHPHSLVSMVLYAKDIVETDFLSLPPDTSVLQAAKAMATRHQGFAVVTAPDKGPVGIVTEWDVLAKVVAQARDPAHVHLGGPVGPRLVSDRQGHLARHDEPPLRSMGVARDLGVFLRFDEDQGGGRPAEQPQGDVSERRVGLRKIPDDVRETRHERSEAGCVLEAG